MFLFVAAGTVFLVRGAEFVWVSKLFRPPWYAVFTPARFSPEGVKLAEPSLKTGEVTPIPARLNVRDPVESVIPTRVSKPL